MKQKLLQGSVSDWYRHRCRLWTPETLTLTHTLIVILILTLALGVTSEHIAKPNAIEMNYNILIDYI